MPDLLTTAQAAKLAGCYYTTIHRWVQTGRLTPEISYGVGAGNGHRFTVEAVWEAMADHRTPRQRKADDVADWLVSEFGLERIADLDQQQEGEHNGT